MLNLQLNRAVLDLLPVWLQPETSSQTFDYKYSIMLNEFWLVQTMVALVYCLGTQRFLPQTTESSSWAVRQFKSVLVMHSVWYILELVITKISTELWELALHHLVSIPIFLMGLAQPNCFSVVYLAPYFWHELYYLSVFPLAKYYPGIPWLSNLFPKYGLSPAVTGYAILLIYNANLLISALISGYLALKSRGNRISRIILIVGLLLVAVNYWGHCESNQQQLICKPYAFAKGLKTNLFYVAFGA